MYGKHFASMYTGSMLGAGANILATWGWVISHVVDGAVELNPKLIAFHIGMTPDEVKAAIDFLCQPDPDSRNCEEDGRRLVHEAAFQYRVVSHAHYRAIKSREDQQIYERERKREYRRKRAETTQSVSTRPDSPNAPGHVRDLMGLQYLYLILPLYMKRQTEKNQTTRKLTRLWQLGIASRRASFRRRSSPPSGNGSSALASKNRGGSRSSSAPVPLSQDPTFT